MSSSSTTIISGTARSYPRNRTLAFPDHSSHAGRQAAKRIAFAVAFVAFCSCAFVAAWYGAALFENESYKAVVLFLTVIVISNVASKYAVWRMKETKVSRI